MFLNPQQTKLLMILRWIHPALIAFVAVGTGTVSELMAIFLISVVIWWFDLGRKLKGSWSSGNARKSGNLQEKIGVQFRALRIKNGMKQYIAKYCCSKDADGEFQPWARVRSYIETDTGWRVTVMVENENQADQLVRSAGNIGRTILGRNSETPRVHSPQSCVVEIDLRTHDALAGIRDADSSSSVESTLIVAGRLDNGQDLEINLADAVHTAVQGETRSGKSVFLYNILAQASKMPQVQIWGFDPNRVLLSPHAQLAPERFALGVKDSDQEQISKLCDDLTDLLDARLMLLDHLGLDKLSDFSPETPICAVVFEESPGLFGAIADSDRSKKPADRLEPKVRATLSRLLMEGAKVGFRLFVIAQRFDASVIGGAGRSQLARRITFRVDTNDAVTMLHPGTEPQDVKRIKAFPVGMCFFQLFGKCIDAKSDRMEYDAYRSAVIFSQKRTPPLPPNESLLRPEWDDVAENP